MVQYNDDRLSQQDESFLWLKRSTLKDFIKRRVQTLNIVVAAAASALINSSFNYQFLNRIASDSTISEYASFRRRKTNQCKKITLGHYFANCKKSGMPENNVRNSLKNTCSFLFSHHLSLLNQSPIPKELPLRS